MKNLILTFMTAILLASFNTASDNPFLTQNKNRYSAPAFDKIKNSHYLPAFDEGIKRHQAEIDAIANNADTPTFENTIAALDYSGELLRSVTAVFFNMLESNTNDEMDSIAATVTPILSAHSDNLSMNDKLFVRIKYLQERKDALGLNTEQTRLLEYYYRDFVRNGAALDEQGKEQLRQINSELGLAELEFGKNVLAETNAFCKIIDNESELAGLPEGIRQAAAETATEKGFDGKWAFTLHKASFIPVLQYSDNRTLRRELLMAYTQIANHNNEYDNKPLINKIMKLRIKKSQLLGFNNPAEFILDDQMAKTTDAVYQLLNLVWQPALAKAKQEATELQQLMNSESVSGNLQAWDWWYYAEKLRKQKYDLEEEQLRPYFKLENVRAGVFGLAEKLYGLKFEKINDVPVYHPDVEVFKVNSIDGKFIGILYTDYYPRASKRAGAWMDNLVGQYKKDGIDHRPIIVNVGNLTKPTADKPSLLTMDEVETMFHEFGHALHGLLSDCTYPSLSGTNVPRDFVEMPSQIMENWCFEPQVMKTYARHYITGEEIPDELIAKINNASKFNQGFVETELLAASILDMDYHSLSDTADIDVNAFEKASLERMGMIPEIIVRYRSTFFNHIFKGGYAAGYYSYTWAAVLDADAFESFKETGDVYNSERATSFRQNILERGNSEDPMTLYRRFRGGDPKPDALLERQGLK
ncbi:MAG: M3 family metallopeptidase [Paludibacter sp.]|jgi:peptidyl-dipeptidase Dcp|nr:M3 family metallopeptidase [Paludibacter sp.]